MGAGCGDCRCSDLGGVDRSMTAVEKLKCCICHQSYEIRSDAPMWASVWDFCPTCQLEDDKHD